MGADSVERRTFLKWAIGCVNAVGAMALGIPVVRLLFDPLLRRAGQKAEFHRIAPLSALPTGRPARFPVVAQRMDAFTRYPREAIGSVWLTRDATGEGGATEPSVRCFQATCPHLGCAVDFAADRGVFACPCHASDFDVSGKRLDGPAPRDMDILEVRLTPADANGERWVEVRYVDFRPGIPDQVAVSG
jgi:Rieske Fe-S protein